MHKFLEATVAQCMTRGVQTVSRDLPLRDLEKMFEEHDYNTYPVVDDRQLIGIVTKYDFLKCFAFSPAQMVPPYAALMRRTVGEVMTPDFIYVHPETPLPRVLRLMVDHRTRSLPVVDAESKLLGIISREDVMRALAQAAGEAGSAM